MTKPQTTAPTTHSLSPLDLRDDNRLILRLFVLTQRDFFSGIDIGHSAPFPERTSPCFQSDLSKTVE